LLAKRGKAEPAATPIVHISAGFRGNLPLRATADPGELTLMRWIDEQYLATPL